MVSQGVPDLPCLLQIERRPSRLSSPSCQTFTTLHHLTSDEAAQLMLAQCSSWECWSVEQEPVTDQASLLLIRVKGMGAKKTPLKASAHRARTTSCGDGVDLPDALRDFLSLPIGDPTVASTGGAPATAASSVGSTGIGASAFSLLDAGNEDMVGSFDEALASMSLDIVEAACESAAAMPPGEVAEPGVGPLDSAELAPEASGGKKGDIERLLEAAVQIDDADAGPTAAAAGDAASSTSGPSASSTASSVEPPPPPPPPEAPLDPDDLASYSISQLGHVCHRSNPDRPIGRLTRFKNNISMSCYRHSGCSVVVSAARHSDEHMLRWLVRGVALPATAPSELRRAEGARHKNALVKL